jgi:hypothetical protein
MAVIEAKIVNLIGWGEVARAYRTKKTKGWRRDTCQVKLGRHTVTIKQRKKALEPKNRNALRGQTIDSSTMRVSHVKTFEEGEDIVVDICWLLSFATQSHVVAYNLKFGKRLRGHSVAGTYNSWRPPFGNGIGSLTDFLKQTWPNYQRLKSQQPIHAFIHMLDASDISGRVMESSISFSMQVLESIKSYWAINDGPRHGITESPQGRFVKGRNNGVPFKDLLELTLKSVGMQLPPSITTIIRLRNALIHRGFVGEADQVTAYIFGPLKPGALHEEMFKVMEEVHDTIREYLLRLLGYKGDFWLYSGRGSIHKTIP